tara:strand:- start:1387 stop:2442 length:1056 start_codon:yes stop_codon:yes gene_type:complete
VGLSIVVETKEFDYFLPDELIARFPLKKRSDSRILYVSGNKKSFPEALFPSLSLFLNDKDVLIMNDTRVIKSRLIGKKKSGGVVEFLCTRILSLKTANGLLRSNRPIKIDSELFFAGKYKAIVEEKLGEEYLLRFEFPIKKILEAVAMLALPPYMGRDSMLADEKRYQTIYGSKPGAIAAPTAGLHFDEELINVIKSKGVEVGFITLHVGLGTFKPVRSKLISHHQMHEEYFSVSEKTVDLIKRARARGGRVVAVGTTTLRALESISDGDQINAFEGNTGIFIFPGYEFNVVDVLVTNFHLPKSTLLMLVYAFGGIEQVRAAYKHAIEKKFRFYSYGDAMCISRRCIENEE